MPTLATLDGAGRVIYANTFSKTLGGAFRIGYVVLPEELAERFRDKLGFYTCTVGALEQLTLARFMESATTSAMSIARGRATDGCWVR